MQRKSTYATTTCNGTLPSRARLLAVEEFVAVVRLRRLVEDVVDRIAFRIAKQCHLDVVAGPHVQRAVRILEVVLAGHAEFDACVAAVEIADSEAASRSAADSAGAGALEACVADIGRACDDLCGWLVYV